MTAKNIYGKYYKFLAYLLVVVLINIAGLTLFFRIDLTSNGIYSLSEASREAVSTLSEPLTINVFFTKNLPAPHNNTERYLHDLLEEYSVHSNKYFNYRFYDVSPEEGEIDEEAKRNQQMARNYGIYAVQIQNIEQDEVKFQKAYMGAVLIHGDVIEKIPAITSTEGLEYTITSKIEKMNNKISALLNLEEPIRVKLFLSSSIESVEPQLRMSGLLKVPDRIKAIVDEMNEKYYGKLEYSRLDPSADTLLQQQAARYNILTLRWPSMKDRTGNEVLAAGSASAGIVVEKGDRFEVIPLIHVVNLPLFGTQYQLADMEKMGEELGEVIDDVIDINKKIGYLSGHGTLPIAAAPYLPEQGQRQQETLSNLNKLVSQDYSISNVLLGQEGISEGIDCLIIAGPKEEFSDYELFQIDQFLMKGKSLALFLDSFDEIAPPQDQRWSSYNQGPIYRPINTGLEKLLNHYGVMVKKSYVLDKNCFEQQLPQMYGGGKRPIYFAPIIKNEFINRDLPFMENIKALITLMTSPIELRRDTIKSNGMTSDILFSSSEQSWEMSGRINLNPMFMNPPSSDEEMKSQPLAVLIQGKFPSYFAGREMPEKPVEEDVSEEEKSAGGIGPKEDRTEEGKGYTEAARSSSVDSMGITGEGTIIEKGKPGKLLLVASSRILWNNVLDEGGESTTSTFVMNLLDYLNGRDAYAAMRSKMQRFNPLTDSAPAVKAFVKTFNIAGLPVIVILSGIVVWMRRTSRKRVIQTMFMK